MTNPQPRRYIDFKLYLTRSADGEGCQVSLLPTPEVGETVTPVVVPAAAGPPAEALELIAQKAITVRQLVAFGKWLAAWLLPADEPNGERSIRSLFYAALAQAGPTGGVRLRLIIADHALKQWPWEYVYCDPLGAGGPEGMHGFLALDPRISIVRHEPLPHPHPTPSAGGADPSDLRMVIAAAAPETQQPLDVQRELGAISGALQGFAVEGVRITPVPLPDATAPEVAQALQGAGSTAIFHFAGHGATEAIERDPFSVGQIREEGWLFFLADKTSRREQRVRADDLAVRLQAAGVRLAVFGACASGTRSMRYPWDGVAGALVRRGIAAVVAMQYEVIDTYAIAFARAFYTVLAAGLSLDEAFAAGRLAMYGENGGRPDQVGLLEWGVPVLYSRLPDGRLFPERMAQAGAAAAQIQLAVQQTIDTITAGGQVIGLQAQTVDGQFTVVQRVKQVDGKLVGANLEHPGSSGTVDQDLGTVSGNVTGIRIGGGAPSDEGSSGR